MTPKREEMHPGRCKTCKWWSERNDIGGLSDCRRAYYLTYELDHLRIIGDDSAFLVTGPDFGCIHHEETPNDPQA